MKIVQSQLYKKHVGPEKKCRIILPGGPQRLLSGPIIFIILIVDLFLTFKEAEVANFVQYNTVCTEKRNVSIFYEIVKMQ